MAPAKLPQQRLYHQRLGATHLDSPADVVRCMYTAQAQDYPSSAFLTSAA
jgi:hypothetical protein